MGLDNGFIVSSGRREIDRSTLEACGVQFCFDSSDEISYHRKDWGWRDSIFATFGWKDYNFVDDDESFEGYYIDTPAQLIKLIELTASWLDEEKWEDEGRSIWTYEEVRPRLIRDIVNFSIILGLMKENPDIYLQFYDSY